MGLTQSNQTIILGEENVPISEPSSIDIIKENQIIFTNFYKTPTIENYKIIRKYDKLYFDSLGIKYMIYYITLNRRYNFGENFSNTFGIIRGYLLNKWYDYEMNRLMKPTNLLSASDLDSLWCLYYATGDTIYPNRIRGIAFSNDQHILVRSAAIWSYNSHVNQKMLDAELITPYENN